jgi:hypothetical protein
MGRRARVPRRGADPASAAADLWVTTPLLQLSKPSKLVLPHATRKRTSCCNCSNLKSRGSRETRIRDANALSMRKAATAGLIDSQRRLRAARWLAIQEPNWPRSIRPWHSRRVPGIGSEDVGAGTGLGAAFDALPQLAAEAEGCSDAEERQGAGDCGRRGVWGCDGPGPYRSTISFSIPR